MKKLLLIILSTIGLSFSNGFFAQTQPGDYQAAGHGSWSNSSIWRIAVGHYDQNGNLSYITWDPTSSFPGFGFAGTVNTAGYTLNLDIPMSLSNLHHTSGYINLLQHLTLTGSGCSMSGGTIIGPDSLTVTTGATVSGMSGISTYQTGLSTKVINNGTVNLSSGNPSNIWSVSATCSFVNNGVINLIGNNQYLGIGGDGTFINTATGFVNSLLNVNNSNSGDASISTISLVNNGTFNSNGTAKFVIGHPSTTAVGSVYNGAFHSNGSGGFRFEGNNAYPITETFSNTSVIDGSGPVSFITNYSSFDVNGTYSIGSTTIDGGAKVFFNMPTINFTNLSLGGNTLGGSAVKTVSNAMTWWGGKITGGNFTIASGATCGIGPVNNGPMAESNFINNGTINWTNNNYCCLQSLTINTATFTNNGIMNMQCLGGAYQNFTGSGTFTNSNTGVMNLSTSNSAFTLSMSNLNHSGVINNNGTSPFQFAIGNNCTISGILNDIGSGGFKFQNGSGGFQFQYSNPMTTYTFTSTSRVTGKFLQNDGNNLIFNGVYTIDSTVQNFGEMNFNMPTVTLNRLVFKGLNLGGSATKTIVRGININSTLSGGTITLNAGSVNTIANNPAITANIINRGSLSFSGLNSIFGRPALKRISLLSSSLVNMKVGGISNSDFDGLNLSESITLGGTLKVAFVNGFVPHVNDSFKLAEQTSVNGQPGTPITGTFSNISLPGGFTGAIITDIDNNNNRRVFLKITGCSISGSANKTDALCFGQGSGSITAQATSGNAPFEYAIGSSGIFTSSNIFINLTAGNKLVRFRDASGCLGSTSVTILQPTKIIPSYTINNVTGCFGDNNGSITNINATGGVAPFKFKIKATDPFVSTTSFTGLKAGNYYLYAQDNNGCIVNSPVITLTQPARMTTTASANPVTGCFGNANGSFTNITTVNGTAPFIYSLSRTGPFSSVSSFAGLTGKSYKIYVKDNMGCFDSTSNIVITQPTKVTVPTYTITNPGICGVDPFGSITNVAASGGTGSGYTYSLKSTGPFSTNTSFTNLSFGSYYVYAKDLNGCAGNSPKITISNCSRTPVAGKLSPIVHPFPIASAWSVYPNPSSSMFKLTTQTAKAEAVHIRVLDINGKVVYSANGSPTQSFTFGEAFANGVYLIEVRQGNEIKNIKAVKSK